MNSFCYKSPIGYYTNTLFLGGVYKKSTPQEGYTPWPREVEGEGTVFWLYYIGLDLGLGSCENNVLFKNNVIFNIQKSP